MNRIINYFISYSTKEVTKTAKRTDWTFKFPFAMYPEKSTAEAKIKYVTQKEWDELADRNLRRKITEAVNESARRSDTPPE